MEEKQKNRNHQDTNLIDSKIKIESRSAPISYELSNEIDFQADLPSATSTQGAGQHFETVMLSLGDYIQKLKLDLAQQVKVSLVERQAKDHLLIQLAEAQNEIKKTNTQNINLITTNKNNENCIETLKNESLSLNKDIHFFKKQIVELNSDLDKVETLLLTEKSLSMAQLETLKAEMEQKNERLALNAKSLQESANETAFLKISFEDQIQNLKDVNSKLTFEVKSREEQIEILKSESLVQKKSVHSLLKDNENLTKEKSDLLKHQQVLMDQYMNETSALSNEKSALSLNLNLKLESLQNEVLRRSDELKILKSENASKNQTLTEKSSVITNLLMLKENLEKEKTILLNHQNEWMAEKAILNDDLLTLTSKTEALKSEIKLYENQLQDLKQDAAAKSVVITEKGMTIVNLLLEKENLKNQFSFLENEKSELLKDQDALMNELRHQQSVSINEKSVLTLKIEALQVDINLYKNQLQKIKQDGSAKSSIIAEKNSVIKEKNLIITEKSTMIEDLLKAKENLQNQYSVVAYEKSELLRSQVGLMAEIQTHQNQFENLKNQFSFLENEKSELLKSIEKQNKMIQEKQTVIADKESVIAEKSIEIKNILTEKAQLLKEYSNLENEKSIQVSFKAKALQNISKQLNSEKQALAHFAQQLVLEIETSKKLNPLFDILKVTQEEMNKVEMQLKKTPVVSFERPQLEKYIDQLNEQCHFLKKSIEKLNQQSDVQLRSVSKLAGEDILRLLPPVPEFDL